jgi:hypothetical protein
MVEEINNEFYDEDKTENEHPPLATDLLMLNESEEFLLIVRSK